MDQKDPSINRRRSIKVIGSGIASLGFAGMSSANPNSQNGKDNRNRPSDLNTAFNPQSNTQVERFAKNIITYDKSTQEKIILQELDERQQNAVANAFKPNNISTEIKRKDTGVLSTTSSRDQQTFVHSVTATGLGGVTAYTIEHEIEWLYETDGPLIEDVSNAGRVVELNALWSDNGSMTDNISKNFNSSVDGYVSFESERVRKMTWVAGGYSDFYPYSILLGDQSGASSVKSDYDGGV